MLKNWLPFQNKNNIKCKLIYDSDIDGDNASTFHSLCKYKKGTLTVISTSDNKKIGGFISLPLKTRDFFSVLDKNAFLFSLNSNEKFKSLHYNSFYNIDSGGPHFGYYGGDNFNISIKDNYLTSYDNYYSYYGKCYDFGKKNKDKEKYFFKVINLEIFQIYE